jgi:hypothetical protein
MRVVYGPDMVDTQAYWEEYQRALEALFGDSFMGKQVVPETMRALQQGAVSVQLAETIEAAVILLEHYSEGLSDGLSPETHKLIARLGEHSRAGQFERGEPKLGLPDMAALLEDMVDASDNSPQRFVSLDERMFYQVMDTLPAHIAAAYADREKTVDAHLVQYTPGNGLGPVKAPLRASQYAILVLGGDNETAKRFLGHEVSHFLMETLSDAVPGLSISHTVYQEQFAQLLEAYVALFTSPDIVAGASALRNDSVARLQGMATTAPKNTDHDYVAQSYHGGYTSGLADKVTLCNAALEGGNTALINTTRRILTRGPVGKYVLTHEEEVGEQRRLREDMARQKLERPPLPLSVAVAPIGGPF